MYQDPKFECIIGKNEYPLNWDIVDVNPFHFSFFRGGITQTIPYKTIHLKQVYTVIKEPYYKKLTDAYRNSFDPNLKKKMDYVTFSAICQKRSEKGVISHSNMLCIDLDKLENIAQTKEILLQDQTLEILLLFVSPSGNGLKCIIKIDRTKEHHLSWFEASKNYFKNKLNITVDESGKDTARACFLCYDPKCYIHPKFLKV